MGHQGKRGKDNLTFSVHRLLYELNARSYLLEHVRNVMALVQKPDLVFQRNGRVHLNWLGGGSSRLLAAEVCVSAVVMVVMLR